MSLSFRCVVKIDNSAEIPQYVKFTSPRSHISGCLDKIGREYSLQPEFLKGEMNHSEIGNYNYIELGHVWEPYLKSDVLNLAVIYARDALEKEKRLK